jgi:hypothetical protein
VHEPEVVEIGDDVCERGDETSRSLEFERAHGVEGVTAHELGAQHDAAGVRLAGDDLDDARVARRGKDLGLVPKANGVSLVPRPLLGDDPALVRHGGHDPSAHVVADYRRY